MIGGDAVACSSTPAAGASKAPTWLPSGVLSASQTVGRAAFLLVLTGIRVPPAWRWPPCWHVVTSGRTLAPTGAFPPRWHLAGHAVIPPNVKTTFPHPEHHLQPPVGDY